MLKNVFFVCDQRDLARQEEERKHTFSPHLSARQQSSSPDNVYDRLSAPKSESETKRRLHPSGRTLFEREIEECTFSPAINPESRLIQYVFAYFNDVV